MCGADQRGTSTLSVSIKSQNNNFLLLRHILVLGVLYTHSLALLFPGAVLPDPLFALSEFSINCASAAVCVFFTLSGLLIAQSGYATSSVDEFLTKRWLRIFPALLASLGISYLALPAFFHIPLAGIFQDSCHFGILSYVEIAFLFTLSILVLRRLRGTSYYQVVGIAYFALLIVLLTGASTLLRPAPRSIDLLNYIHTCAGTGVCVRGSMFENMVINLSIWSIRYELLMYAIAAFFMFFPRSFWEFLWGMTFVVSVSVLFFAHERKLLENLDWITPFLRFLACFAVGVLLHMFSEYIKIGLLLPFLFCCCFLLTWYAGFPAIGFVYFGTASIVLLFSCRPWFSRWKELDISYGMFVYGYLVQMVFLTLFPGIRDLRLVFLCTSLSAALIALMSWYWCEKPCLRLKSRFYGKA